MRVLIPLLTAAFLSGCTSVQDPFLTAAISQTPPAGAAVAREVAPHFAVAYLPSVAGDIRAVRQTVPNGNSFRQEIVYANQTSLPGENIVLVELGRVDGDGKFLRAPARSEIARDIRKAFPGLRMSYGSIEENVQGVFGYATAPLEGGGSCLYGWQFVAKFAREGNTLSAFTRKPHPAQMRVRFCHPSIPQERIVALMRGLRLKPVTPETVEMLRFAEGTAPVALAPSAASVPAVSQTVAVRQVWETRAAPSQAKEPEMALIRNAVTVPLPNVSKARRPEQEAENLPVVKAAARIPLPGEIDTGKAATAATE